MKDAEKHTYCEVITEPMLLGIFIAAVANFQLSIGKTRDLMHYILLRYQKLCIKNQETVFLMLRVNHIKRRVTPICADCKHRLNGNGRSFKYTETRFFLPNGHRVTLLICTLCPQLCCEHCHALDKQYCHKILPADAVYYLSYETVQYEQGILGDLNGRCLLTDNTIIRRVKDFAEKIADLLPRPPGAVRAAIKR